MSIREPAEGAVTLGFEAVALSLRRDSILACWVSRLAM